MPSQGPLLSGSSTNVSNGSGNAWTNPNNINNSDGVYAVGPMLISQYTDDLYTGSHGFSIPAGATINGITVNITGNSSGGSGTCRIYGCYMIKGGSGAAFVGSPKGPSTYFGSSDSTYTFGSASDLWGTTWDAATINSNNFGVKVIAESTLASASMRIDTISIAVDYTPAATGGMFFGFVRKAWELFTGKRRVKTQVRTFRPQPAFAGV